MLKVLSVAAVALAATIGFADAAPAVNMQTLCTEMQGIFKLLRNLAFIGAAFVIAGWAWGYISGGEFKFAEEAKKKGLALLVGFVMLSGVGVVLSMFTTYCATGW
jgi:hypothetical protein